MNDIPWAMLAEASITYADRQGIDLEYDGIELRYRPPGGLTASDYEFFGVEPPYNDPAPLISDRWYHDRGEQVPPSFPWGPLRGTQEQVAAWLYSGQRGRKKPDARPLHGKAASGTTIWVRKVHRTLYEVWFRHEGDYARAAQIAAEGL